jgi:hypothetical protein
MSSNVINVIHLKCEETHDSKGVPQYRVYIKTDRVYEYHEGKTVEEAFNGVVGQVLGRYGVSLNGRMPTSAVSAMFLRSGVGMMYQASANCKLNGSDEIIVITDEHVSAVGALLLAAIKALARLGIKVQAMCLK